MKYKKNLLIGFSLLIFLFSVSAYTIVGNSVIQEDTVSKLKVYPHTATSPFNQFTQTFELTNKTAQTQSVFVAYKFDNPLSYGKVEYFMPPTYSWLETEHQYCNNSYVVEMDKNVGAPNPNWIKCYKTWDNNTVADPSDDYNTTFFETYFNGYALDQNRVDIAHYTIISGNKWVDVTSLFSPFAYLNDELYYLANPVSFLAGETKKWRLTYTPNTADTTKKWEMVFYTGTDASCILSGSCTYVQWLDPWWNTNYTNKVPINDLNITSNLTAGKMIALKGIDLTQLNIACADLNDLRVVNEDTSTELNRVIEGTSTSTDANIFFNTDVNLVTGIYTGKFYLYYNNTTCSSPPTTVTYGDELIDDCSNTSAWTNRIDSANISFETQSTTSITGNACRLYTNGANSSDWEKWDIPATNTNHIGFYIYFTATASDFYFGTDQDTALTGLNWLRYGDNLQATGWQAWPNGTLSTNTWYWVEIQRVDNTHSNYFIKNQNKDTNVDNVTNVLNSYSNSWADNGTIYPIVWVKDGASSAWSLYFDDLYKLESGADITPAFTIGTEQNQSTAPDLNVLYPNGGESIAGTQDISFRVRDADYNTLAGLDLNANISIRNMDTNELILVVADLNLLATGVCGDTNFQTNQDCNYSYNFSGNLLADTNYQIDINVTDQQGLIDSDSSDGNFTVQVVIVSNGIMAKVNLLDLTVDGVNLGEDSEAWTQGESKSKDLNAVNVNRYQYLIIKALNDNTTLTVYINSNLIGTIDSNASNPQTWQWYIFKVDSAYLLANPQTITIDAGATQADTYIDYIALMDSQDSNYLAGGKSIGMLWNVAKNGNVLTRNFFTIDENGSFNSIDANAVTTTDGNYFGLIENTASLDQNVNGWASAISGGSTYVADTNKSITYDSTPPVINTITMTLNVIKGRTYGFDSNITEHFFKNAVLNIEGVDYDLNSELINGWDYNAYGSFLFAGDGNYSCSITTWDKVNHSTAFDFTVKSSDINQTIASEDVNNTIGFSRNNPIDINSTQQFLDMTFKVPISYIATGTANITNFDFNYSLYNGTQNIGNRGAVKNVIFTRANKSNITLNNFIDHNGLIASDLNGNTTLSEWITYDVNNAIAVQWKNTGASDARLVHIKDQDVNTSLTDVWLKVELRTPFDPASYKIQFKECTSGIDFTNGTCTQYTAYNIYDESDSSFNGGTFPTEDSDGDGLKDVVYFKASTLSEHMYYLDLTAVAEPTWTTPANNTGASGGGGGSTKKTPVDEVVENASKVIQDSPFWQPIFNFLGILWGGLSGLAGGLTSAIGLNMGRLGYIDWTGNAVFYLFSIGLIVAFLFLALPQAKKTTSNKNFSV